MTLLTREAINITVPFEKVEVDVSEWSITGERTTVFVRELSARERDAFEASLVTGNGKKTKTDFRDMRAKLAVATCCDANGNPLFLPEDIETLSGKSAKVLDRICDAARKLNGMDTEDEEETVKN